MSSDRTGGRPFPVLEQPSTIVRVARPNASPGSVPSTPRSDMAQEATTPLGDLPSVASLDVAWVTARPQEDPEHLFRMLLGAYLAGAREFVVREEPAITSGTREVVRTFCRRTLGPEVVSEEKETVRLRDLAFDRGVPLERLIARMGRTVVEFHREAVESWAELPLREDGFWERRDDEVDREAWYIERFLARERRPVGGGARSLGLWTTARSLERIADHAVALGEAGRQLGEVAGGASAPTTFLRQYHHQAMEHLEGALAARGGGEANELLDMGAALIVSGRSLADRILPEVSGGGISPATAAVVARILESIVRTIAYAQDIAQVALDRSYAVGPDGSSGTRSSFAPV